MTLTTLIAELEEALKAATPEPWFVKVNAVAPDMPPDICANIPGACNALTVGGCMPEDARLIALMRNSLPTLIEALKRQGEAKDTPIWGVWVDYNLAPPGSYACLVSSFVNGEWSDPEARWMPAQGRPRLQGQIRIMPHLMPNDPLTAHKGKSDV